MLILPRHLFAGLRSWSPALLEQNFDPSTASQTNAWLDKLEVALADSVLHDKYKHDIVELRRVTRMQSDESINRGPNITQMIANIHNVADGRGPTAIIESHHELPRDNEVQLFPSCDHLEMPADALVSMNDPWGTKMDKILHTGSMVICTPMGAQVDGANLPFFVGHADWTKC